MSKVQDAYERLLAGKKTRLLPRIKERIGIIKEAILYQYFLLVYLFKTRKRR